jgi:molecular chaperone DnaK
VLQGERPMAANNRTIGRFHLDGIPSAPRGVPQIEVTFDIDANGILNVSASDKGTGKSQQIRIEASSGLSEDEINRMKAEAEANAEADKKAKDEADKLNAASALIFQTEKQLKEYGEKISEEKRTPIEEALKELKEAESTKELEKIEPALEKLNAAWTAASEELYKATQEGKEGGNTANPFEAFGGENPFANAGNPFGGDGSTTSTASDAPPSNEGEVSDAEFEEVK